MLLVYQQEWVPMQPPKTIFQNDHLSPFDISLNGRYVASEK